MFDFMLQPDVAAPASSSSLFDFMLPRDDKSPEAELPEPSAHSSSSVEVIDDSDAESKPARKHKNNVAKKRRTRKRLVHAKKRREAANS